MKGDWSNGRGGGIQREINVSPEHPDQEENAYRYQYPSPFWERAHESTRGGLSASANQDSGEKNKNWVSVNAATSRRSTMTTMSSENANENENSLPALYSLNSRKKGEKICFGMSTWNEGWIFTYPLLRKIWPWVEYLEWRRRANRETGTRMRTRTACRLHHRQARGEGKRKSWKSQLGWIPNEKSRRCICT